MFSFNLPNLPNLNLIPERLDEAVKRDLGLAPESKLTTHDIAQYYESGPEGLTPQATANLASLTTTIKVIGVERQGRLQRQNTLYQLGASITPSLPRTAITLASTYAGERLLSKDSKALYIAVANAVAGYAVDYATNLPAFNERFDWPIVINPLIDRSVLTGLLGIPLMKGLAPTRSIIYSFLEFAGSDYASRLAQPVIQTIQDIINPPLSAHDQEVARLNADALARLSPEERAEHLAGHPNAPQIKEPGILSFLRGVGAAVVPGVDFGALGPHVPTYRPKVPTI